MRSSWGKKWMYWLNATTDFNACACVCMRGAQVDQKLNEELMGQEVDALVKCVDQHKAMLQDQMLGEVRV